MSNFIKNVQDVTVPFPRSQSEVEEGVTTSSTPEIVSEVPQNITIEGAINFFEKNAVGEYERLYKFTAKALREKIK